MINAEQFAEWKAQPTTIEIFTLLKEVRKALQDRVSSGGTLAPEADVTHGLTNKIVGQIDGLNQLLNISYEDTHDVLDVSNITGH